MALSKFSSVREYDFVESAVSKDYECPVCFEILKDPFLTECCGNHFCEACIETTKTSTDHCPFCKAKPIKGIVDKKLQRRINELKVYCLQKKHGCPWKGRLDELTKHLATDNVQGCKYAMISCSLSCGKQLFRYELHEHLNDECPQRPYICNFCSYSSTYEDVTNHFSKCPEYPVTCPNSCMCEEFKRCKLDQHLLMCPNEIVLCSFSEMGCTERMKRCHLQQHMETLWMQHQLMMCDAFKQIKKENEMLRKDNEEIKRAQMTVDYWINGYKMMAEGVMKTNWREYLQSLGVVSTNIPEPVCPVILKWTDYEVTKSKANKGGYSFYYLRPFYTYLGGYRMQLQVYPNGIDDGKGTHISVYGYLVPGKNDDYLKWPFKGNVTVTLLNQIENSEHFSRELWSSHYAIPEEVAKKPVSTRNKKGWGFSKFILLSEVEDFTSVKQYLINDALAFKISTSV